MQPAKHHIPRFIGLLTCLVCVGATSRAQYVPKSQQARPNVRLANEERNKIQLKTILADPRLVSAKASCEVTSFYISFIPEWGEKYGPVRTEGASFSDEQIKYLKAITNTNVKIIIENIHLSCNGKDATEERIVVTSFP